MICPTNEMNAELQSTRWRVNGTSLTGSSHIASELPCQDAHRWLVHEATGTLVVAVADGAGSRPLSAMGAEIAVTEATESIVRSLEAGESLDEGALARVFEEARAAIFDKAAELGRPPGDLACTLCVLIAFEDRCLEANVGDSAAIVKTSSGELRVVLSPQKGEYVNIATFITGSDWRSDFAFASLEEPISSAIVGTDGLMDWCVRGEEIQKALAVPLFNFAEYDESAESKQLKLEAWLQSEKVLSKVNDDITLVVCKRDS